MNALAGLMNPGAIGQSVQSAFQAGQDTRRERETQNALAAYAQNPNAQGAAAVAQHNPMMGIQLGQYEQQRAAQAQQAEQARTAQQREQLPVMTRLLQGSTDETSWQQARQMAGQYGMDLSQVPQNFDQTWRDQTLAFVTAMQDPQTVSAIQRDVQAMGIDLNTPEGQHAVRELTLYKYAQSGQDGDGRPTLSMPTLQVQGGGQAQQGGQRESIMQIGERAQQSGRITAQEAEAVRQSLGPNGQAAFDRWKAQNNIRVSVRTGTLPDGTRVVEYDDGTIEYAN